MWSGSTRLSEHFTDSYVFKYIETYILILPYPNFNAAYDVLYNFLFQIFLLTHIILCIKKML